MRRKQVSIESNWGSATFSKRHRHTGIATVACSIFALLVVPVTASVLLSVDEALTLAFPDCEVNRESVFLTDAEMSAASTLAGHPRSTALVVRYVARRNDEPNGTAYFDTHRVRTLDETIMVVVNPDGTIGRIEVVSFAEPPDYLPREGWYKQFAGRALDDQLELDRAIRAVTGATLTANATTSAARRVLAVHEVIEGRSKE
jgi:hypothetical protein